MYVHTYVNIKCDLINYNRDVILLLFCIKLNVLTYIIHAFLILEKN